MANLTITAASVLAGSNVLTESGLAGEAVTAGQPVYWNPATKRFGLADANSATAAARAPRGIALNSATSGQPVTVAKSGDITLGAVLTAGTAYYLSDTPGAICPVADVGAGEYVVLLGLAKSASVLALDIQVTGVSL